MEIYRLNDSVCDAPAKKEASLKITEVRQGIKNPNRVNVFIDGKYSFSLDVSQVIDFGVKVGRELTTEELSELKKASEFGKLYQRTLEWVLARPRSIKETKDYLRRKIYEKKIDKIYIDDIIEKLKNKNYVNDLMFAEWYTENRFIKKGVSQRRLAQELMKKGISRDIIEKALSSRNDEVDLKKMISKKRAKYQDDEKLMAYLVRQGFSYDLVKRIVQEDY